MAAFLLRVFSRGREAPQHVEELREEFLLKKHEISQVLLQNAEVRALVEMIFDNSDQETKLFLSSPSISSLKENQDAVSKILVGLSLQDASLFGRLSGAVQEHGVETVSDVVIRVLKLLSHLLVNKQITLDDDLPDSLDYAWQLSSPLSRRPRVHFNIRQQSINRQGLQPASPSHEHDGTKKIVHCMEEAPQVSNKDNVRGQEQEPEPVKEAQNTPAPVEKAEQTESSAGIEKQEERVETSDRDTGLLMIMKVGEQVPHVSGSKNACEPDEERSSSRIQSGRMSYGGSELYTTDSDDDSLSTCSHSSLLVAVSELPDYSDSSSGDGSDLLVLETDHVEPVDVICYSSSDQRSKDEPEQGETSTPNGDLVVDEYNQEASSDDSVEDKLPICSSVVLSRGNSCSENDLSGESESFYTPEMWTYSDKDANDFEAALGRNLEENDTLLQSFDSNEKKTENLEEVRVVMEASFEDKYVTVTVHPVSVQSPGDVTNRSSETGAIEEEPEKILIAAALKVEEDGNSMLVPENRPDVENLDNVEEDDLVELDISADGEKSVEVEPDESVAETASGALKVEQDVNFMAPSHPDIGKLVEEDDPEPEQVKELDSVENIESKLVEEKREVAPSKVESGDSNEKDAEEPEAAARTSSDTLILLDTGKGETTAKDLDTPAVDTNDYSKPDEAGTEPLVTGVIPISGPIVYNGHSGPLPYSGSLSLRSDSSTTSTRSFAFPVLSAEWTSSPVKMAAPERRYSHRRHGRHSWRSLCCFCSVK